MVAAPAVLLILDGASEHPDSRPSSVELARTPNLDRLRHEGEWSMVEHLPPGVPVGSETAIAALLGWVPDGPVDRGTVEAAARGIFPAAGERAWRVDLEGGHRILLVGEEPRPAIEAQVPIRVWPQGLIPPAVLDSSTWVIGAPGAATGLGRLMGATVVTPDGATGRAGSDLGAKRRAALDAIRAGARRVVVHVGGPDEASHARDPAAKIVCLEAADRELIGPLAYALGGLDGLGGTLTICPDHGCDPATGEHVPGPVPCVSWRAPQPSRSARLRAAIVGP